MAFCLVRFPVFVFLLWNYSAYLFKMIVLCSRSCFALKRKLLCAVHIHVLEDAHHLVRYVAVAEGHLGVCSKSLSFLLCHLMCAYDTVLCSFWWANVGDLFEDTSFKTFPLDWQIVAFSLLGLICGLIAVGFISAVWRIFELRKSAPTTRCAWLLWKLNHVAIIENPFILDRPPPSPVHPKKSRPGTKKQH